MGAERRDPRFVQHVAMSRLPYLSRDALDDAGRAVWDRLESTRGSIVLNDEGGLGGPFDAWVTAPDIGARLIELGGALRFASTIELRLLEVAIITTGSPNARAAAILA